MVASPVYYHPPSFRVRLPLSYSEPPRRTAHETFLAKTADSGRIIELDWPTDSHTNSSIHIVNTTNNYNIKSQKFDQLNQSDHTSDHTSDVIIPTVVPIAFTISSDLTTLNITPLHSSPLHNIEILLPTPLLSCKSVDIAHHNGCIVIDMIDRNYLFITIQINPADFVTPRMTLDRLEHWAHISVPYSFELKSDPCLIRALDPRNVVVALANGSLLHFHRAHTLADFDVLEFQSVPALIPLRLWFGRAHDSSEVVDIVAIGDNSFVALTSSQQLCFWSLDSHQQTRKPLSLGSDSINSVPAKRLHVLTHANKSYLVVQSIAFHIFKLDGHETSDHVSFEPVPPGGLPWYVQDFYIRGETSWEVDVLWKANTSSVVRTYAVDSDGNVTVISLPTPRSDRELTPHFDAEYYQKRVCSDYDELIVATATAVMGEKEREEGRERKKESTEEATVLALENSSLEKPSLDSGFPFASLCSLDSREAWFTLYSLCEEYRSLSREALQLAELHSLSLVLQANGVGVCRDPHNFEAVRADLASVLATVEAAVSTQARRKLAKEFSECGEITAERAAEMYATYLSKVPADAVVALQAIPDAEAIVESIISDKNEKNTNEKRNTNENKRTNEYDDYVLVDFDEFDEGFENSHLEHVNIADFDKLVTIAVFRQISQTHRTVLFNLVCLLLICASNDRTLLLLNRVIARLQAHDVLATVLDTCAANSKPLAPIERNGLCRPELSLFWGVVDRHPKLRSLIVARRWNAAFDHLYRLMSSMEEVAEDVAIDLLNRGEGSYVAECQLLRNRAFEVREPSSPLSVGDAPVAPLLPAFLSGLICLTTNNPDEFYHTFTTMDFFALSDEPKVLSLRSPLLAQFVAELRHKDQGRYLHALLKLCEAYEYHEVALRFEMRAIEVAPSAEYYRDAFEIGLRLGRYDVVRSSLEYLRTSVSSSTYRELFTRLISTLVRENRIKELFKGSQSSPYHHLYLLIDSILEGMAANESTVTALRYYEWLYLWRLFGAAKAMVSDELGDKRGAIEALYAFIVRVKSDGLDSPQYKLKVLELYMIILNCLRSLDEEDMWLMGGGRVLGVDEVAVEYHRWMDVLRGEI